MKTGEKCEQTVLITNIQRFCMHDGPGVRTTVFFKGCPLHCKWCHNPETQSSMPEIIFSRSQCILCGACEKVCKHSAQHIIPERYFDRSLCASCGKCAEICPTRALSISGKRITVAQILEEIKKDIPFYGKCGGLTVSGGEPTLQKEPLLSLLRAAKEAHISTVLETCGVFPECIINEFCNITDLFLFDIKDTCAARLKENTGANLTKILKNLRQIDNAGGKTVLRCILIPDVNMNDAHCKSLATLYKKLKNCRYIELLPYHPYGVSKRNELGISVTDNYQVPEKNEILAWVAKLKKENIPVKCFGSETIN